MINLRHYASPAEMLLKLYTGGTLLNLVLQDIIITYLVAFSATNMHRATR